MVKILVPVDGSDCALRAVAQMIAHVGWLRETPEIHLLHVHPPIPVGRVQEHIGRETLDRYYREESEALLAPACAQLDAAKLAYRTHIHVGEPAEVIAKVASDLGCDLIFLGTHGRGAVTAAILGSVVARVLHLAKQPVLLAK
jgi:nucleotide-binding universal stress UspA family protein